MNDQKLFSLNFIDDGLMTLNIRSFDGDKPSTLAGVILTSCDSNLHQHGAHIFTYPFVIYIYISLLNPLVSNHHLVTNLYLICTCRVSIGGAWSIYPLAAISN